MESDRGKVKEDLRGLDQLKNNFRDEAWVSHATPESKQKSVEWSHTSTPTKTKFKHNTSMRKIMCTVFWHRQGVLLVDFVPLGSTINAGVYCDTLKQLSRTFEV
jgi:hypothetical protein